MARQKTWKKWTSKEEKMLNHNVKHCLTLYEAFETTAEKTGRTVSGVTQHYYKTKHVLLLQNGGDHAVESPKKAGFMAFIKNLFKF